MKQRVKSILRDWLCEQPAPPEPDPQPDVLDTVGTHTIDNTRHGERDYTADITIRQSTALTLENGRIPEEMAAVYIEAALHCIGIGARIRYGFDTISPPEENSSCKDNPTFDYYEMAVRHWEHSADDTNVLLVDSGGGGCGQWWGPMVATVTGSNLTERRLWTREGADDWHGNIQAILHEVGHTLSAHHDHKQKEKGNQYPGHATLDHENQAFRYTPTVFNADGGENLCGAPQPDESEYPNYDKVRIHTYTDCAADYFKEYLEDQE